LPLVRPKRCRQRSPLRVAHRVRRRRPHRHRRRAANLGQFALLQRPMLFPPHVHSQCPQRRNTTPGSFQNLPHRFPLLPLRHRPVPPPRPPLRPHPRLRPPHQALSPQRHPRQRPPPTQASQDHPPHFRFADTRVQLPHRLHRFRLRLVQHRDPRRRAHR